MAVSNAPVFPQTPKITPQTFLNADGTTKKTLVTAGPNGTKVLGGFIISTDAGGAHLLGLYLTRASTPNLIGVLTVAANSGADGATPGTKMFNTTLIPGFPLDQFVQPFIYLEPGDTFQANLTVAMPGVTAMVINTISIDF